MKKLLIVGCGDIGLRVAALLSPCCRLFALSHTPERFNALRERNIVPIYGDLDKPASLSRLAGLSSIVLHLAPPQNRGLVDARTRNLLAALSAKGSILPYRLIYISTSGVYGDCNGEIVTETRAARPGTPRAIRRLDAETEIRRWGRRNGVSVSILRVPGIYARERFSPARLEMPVLQASDDVYTNHIHADDLARAIILTIRRGASGRIYNISDDSAMKMGDYFELLAEKFGVPPPHRLGREALQQAVPESMYSFMRESRRLDNRRMKDELGVKLKYPGAGGAPP